MFDEFNALFQDIPRLYSAIAEWMAVFTVLLICRRRVSHPVFAGISAIALAVQCVFMVGTDGVPAGILWVLCMAAAVVMMFLYLYLCGAFTPMTGIYCGALAFLMAEFVASFEWQIHAWVNYWTPLTHWQAGLFVLIIYGLLFFLFYRVEKNHLTDSYLGSLRWSETFSVVLIVFLTFCFSNLSFLSGNTPFSGLILVDIFFIRTLVDIGGLAIVYALQIRVESLIREQEKMAIQNTLMSQYEQYRSNQESERMLHMLQHDLKHQIEGLRAETDRERRAEWLDAMEKELDSWWLPQRSGNPVLDTILSARIRRARTLGIRITCVADGGLLSNIHVIDICTIFGNALDNAMESVVQIPEEERRLIHLSVSAKQNFIFIQVSNTCETEIRRGEDMSLLTTKADRKNHGYGLKSIRYSAEKYGGSVSYEIKNGWFELRILLPRA